ncbi:MAG: polyketide synthase PksN [Flavobacteriales bacterium]|jgi:polyketide synthase PksN
MLDLINRYCHGYIVLPAIYTLKNNNFFTEFNDGKYRSLKNFTEFGLNGGNLAVALRALNSMDLIASNKAQDRWLISNSPRLQGVRVAIVDMLVLAKPGCLKRSELEMKIIDWCNQSQLNWGYQDDVISDFVDGMLMIPLLLDLREGGYLSGDGKVIDMSSISGNLADTIGQLFVKKAWGEYELGLFQLNGAGAYLIDRIMNAGTVMSYAPMLSQMDALLYGNPNQVFTRDEITGHENHIERTLNVVASGFQHEKYFKDIEKIILSIFDNEQFSDQPNYVADMGCGDGSLLKKLYEIVRDKTVRGKNLELAPLTLIGADFNDKALEATALNLKGLPHITIHGDIGDPEQLELDLEKVVTSLEDILHVRSFLDHDRPFKQPENISAAKNKKHIPWEIVGVESSGEQITPEVAAQSLSEHLGRWGKTQTRHGLLILEVHSVPPAIAGEYMDECESLHFDAYHAFSKQHLVFAEHFSIAAAEGGLLPDVKHCRYYSKVMPFKRITLNLLQPRSYSVRYAHPDDLSSIRELLNQVHVSQDDSLTEEYCSNLILRSPQDQYVCIRNGKLIAACFTVRAGQNVLGGQELQSTKDGAVISLVSFLSAPGVEKALLQEFAQYVDYNSRLKSGVEQVVGLELCASLIENRRVYASDVYPLIKNSSERFESSFPHADAERTIEAEMLVAEFATRRLLQIIQKTGHFTLAGQQYSLENLMSGVGVIDKYKRLFKALLHMLSQRGVLAIHGEVYVALAEIEGYSLSDFDCQAAEFEQTLNESYAHIVAFWELTKPCLKSYGDVLTGRVASNDVVFKDGSMELFAKIFKGNPLADFYHNLTGEAIVNALKAKRLSGDNSQFNILEIGSGTGGATEFVLNSLEPYADNVCFYYTDISSSFTRYGRERFAAKYPWVKYAKLDISKNPAEQGFDLKSFDVAFAFNVLHDTDVINNTLGWINRLLKPSGILLMNEYTRIKDMLLFSGGLLHGLWIYKDPELRLPNSCLLSVGQWSGIAEQCGFTAISAYGDPSLSTMEDSWQSIMLCQKIGESTLEMAQQGHMSESSPGVGSESTTYANVDCSNVESELLVLLRQVSEDAKIPVDVDTPIMELGLDSLELVELKSLINKRFSVKLKTSIFFSEGTVAKLAIYLVGINDNAVNSDRQGRDLGVTNPGAELEPVEFVSNSAATLGHPECIEILKGFLNILAEDNAEIKIDLSAPIMELGLDSLELVELRSLINKKLKLQLSTTIFFQCANLDSLADHIVSLKPPVDGLSGKARNTKARDLNFSPDKTSAVKASAVKTNTVKATTESGQSASSSIDNKFASGNVAGVDGEAEVDSSQSSSAKSSGLAGSNYRDKDIAIVGLALDFPGEVRSQAALWSLLESGKSAISELENLRWDWPRTLDIQGSKSHLKSAGFVGDIDTFDADFFRISPKEAELMDPQQRMIMQLAWQAIEDAGYKASEISGSHTGVYIGACHFDYAELAKHEQFREQAYVSTGTNSSLLANRVSYFFNLSGPSMMIDTACSSSLVAIREAAEAIRRGECKQALVGGVNLICTPTNSMVYDKANILSKDARCATFDSAANGFVRGEGGGIFMLKPVKQAEADGDSIYAVIKGVAVNHGGQGTSLTAPNPKAQAALVISALADAECSANSISYIEAHGTGTVLGDPVEVLGLRMAFEANKNLAVSKDSCGLGTIKSNIGHLEGAAGIAGVMKVVSSLVKKKLPATLHYSELNPEIDLLGSPFYIVDKLCSWTSNHPLRAGVSSFGFGGANGHVILEEYSAPKEKVRVHAPQQQLVVFSAKKIESLESYLAEFLRYLEGSAAELLDIAYTLASTRETMDCRAAFVCDSKDQLAQQIQRYFEYLKQSPAPALGPMASILRASEGEKIIASALKSGSLELLAEAWRSGAAVNCQVLFESNNPRRVRLPVYQFFGDKYWLYPEENSHVESNIVKSNEENFAQNNEPAFSLTLINKENIKVAFDPASSAIADHKVDGKIVVAGVLSLEVLSQSIKCAHQDLICSLVDVIWRDAIVITNESNSFDIAIVVASSTEFSLEMSGIGSDGNRKVYVRATAQSKEALVINPIQGVSILKQSLTLKVDGAESVETFYRSLNKLGVEHGPFYRCVESIWASGDTILSALSALPIDAKAAVYYGLHPAIADAALQSISGIVSEKESTVLIPFSLESVDVLGGVASAKYSLATRVSPECYDFCLLTGDGVVVALIKGLKFRRLVPKDPKQLIHKIEWSEDTALMTSEFTKGASADGVLCLSAGMSHGFKQTLQLSGFTNCIELDGQAEVSLLQKLIQHSLLRCGPIDAVRIFISNEIEQPSELFFTLIKAFSLSFSKVEYLDITIVSVNAQSVIDSDPVCSRASGLAAMVRTLACEFKSWSLRNIDVELKDLECVKLESMLSDFINSMGRQDGLVTAYRKGMLFRPQLKSIKNLTTVKPIYKHGGVYVIVGGAGDVGCLLSRYIVENYQAQVVWLGRRELDDDIRSKQSKVGEYGFKPKYIQVDILDLINIKNVVERVKEEFPVVSGVFHSAANVCDRLAVNMSLSEFKQVQDVKVEGSRNLVLAFQRENLDFLCLFSSIRSEFGAAGQCNYASACGFQNGLSQELLNNSHFPVFSIAWGLWGELGLAKGKASELARQGLLPLQEDDCFKALEALIYSGQMQALVVNATPEYLKSYGIDNVKINNIKIDNAHQEVSKDLTFSGEKKTILELAEQYLVDLIARSLKMMPERVFLAKDFEAYGIDSMMVIELTESLEKTLGKLPKTLFFEHRNIHQLAGYLASKHSAIISGLAELSDSEKERHNLPAKRQSLSVDAVDLDAENLNLSVEPPKPHAEIPSSIVGAPSFIAEAPSSSESKNSRNKIPPGQSRNKVDSYAKASSQEQNPGDNGDVAIIGVSGRYPQAKNLDEYWDNLKEGRDCITEVPESRWDAKTLYDQGKINTKWGGFIADADKFDPLFFNISPREAEHIDPQERLFLEVVWETMEDAGYTRDRIKANSEKKYGANVGVYVGVMYEEYKFFGVEKSLNGDQLSLSGHPASIANRVSYHCDFRGPSMAVDTMCSSSLTAIHIACKSIRDGECDYAFAGGVNLNLHADKYIYLNQGQFSSTDGRCRSFGEGGDGFVPSEGVGAVLLKPLAKAIADGDQIYAVIKGSAINHGGKTNGYTVPDPVAQGELIEDAFARSTASIENLSYVETHGTGTPLGDPIELAGLNKALASRKSELPCSIGSVKSNIGHCESAAGIAALTKVLLQLKHKQLVPSLHSKTLNNNCDFSNGNLRVQQELSDWAVEDESPRLAGVSSFGAGGANAHLIVEEFRPINEFINLKSLPDKRIVPILLSARNEDRLKVYATTLLTAITNIKFDVVSHGTDDFRLLQDIAFTLCQGREPLHSRLAICVTSIRSLIDALGDFLASNVNAGSTRTGRIENLVEAKEEALRDEELQESIRASLQTDNVEALVDAWLVGAEVSWKVVFARGEYSGRVLSLPVYPFQKTRYWVDLQAVDSNKILDANTSEIVSMSAGGINTLLHKNVSTFSNQRFESKFTGTESVFLHHKVGDRCLLSGTAFISMVYSAARCSFDQFASLKISDLLFVEPIYADTISDGTVELSLHDSSGDVRYELVSNTTNRGKRLHSEGDLSFLTELSDADADHIDLVSIRARCSQSVEHQDIYQKFSSLGFFYGPSYSCLRTVWYSDSEILARIEGHDSAGMLDSGMLDPGMFDSALQSLIVMLDNEFDNKHYIPFSIDCVSIHEELPQTLYSYASYKGSLNPTNTDFVCFDVCMCDEHGKVLVRADNVVYRQLEKTSSVPSLSDELGINQVQSRCVVPTWKNHPLDLNENTLSGPILIFSNDERRLDEIANAFSLATTTNHVRAVLIDNASMRSNTRFSVGDGINIPRESGSTIVDFKNIFSKMVAAGASPKNIVFDLNYKQKLFEFNSAPYVAVDNLCRALTQSELVQPLRLICASQMKSHSLSPANSAILSYLYVLNNEHSKIQCRYVAYESDSSFASSLVDECRDDSSIIGVRYTKENSRYSRDFFTASPLVVDEVRNSPNIFKSGGVYIIAGGAGGIGEVVARYLSERYGAILILVGRSVFDSQKKSLVNGVAQLGGKAEYYQCDISCGEDVDVLIQTVVQKYSSLNGVIHCAGVAKTRLIKDKVEGDGASILSPKTVGLAQLDRATAQLELDLFVTFSSSSVLFGDGGLSDYAYANAYMDSAMELRAQLVDQGFRSGKSLSINWPYWSDGGMRIDPQQESMLFDLYGLKSLSTREALEDFECCLKLNNANIAVLPGDYEKIYRNITGLTVEVKTSKASVTREPHVDAAAVPSESILPGVRNKLTFIVQDLLKLTAGEVSVKEELKNYGFDSVTFAQLANSINTEWMLSINPTVFFEYHTLSDLSEYLVAEYPLVFQATYEIAETSIHGDALSRSDDLSLSDTVTHGESADLQYESNSSQSTPTLSAPERVTSAVKSPAVDVSNDERKALHDDDPIAIVGISGVMPQSSNLDAFWENLLAGRNLISEVPEERWLWSDVYGDAQADAAKTNSKWGGFVPDFDNFDPAFFNLSVAEVEVMDPQHRLFLQEAWRAIEDAGYAPSSLSGKKIAVYVGLQFQEYQALMQRDSGKMTAHMATGNAHSVLPNRVSYLLNLRGPSEAIDTACSSSLVAIHRAVKSIQSGEVDGAIAGGVSLALSPDTFVLTSQMGAFSSDGQCKTFDKSANGYVKGEGVGAIVLKRLSAAEADGDSIYGLIKASSINHGGKSQSLTAPSANSQAELLVDVYRQANIDPSTVDYIETHGTGTELGDPIEIQGLKKAFNTLYEDRHDSANPSTEKVALQQHIGLGAVKTNTGHLEPAAGMAGLFKILLSLKNNVIPKNLNFSEQNPYIDLGDSPFYLLNKATPWAPKRDRFNVVLPRRAGLSSFGFGGVNAHLIIEDYSGHKRSSNNQTMSRAEGVSSVFLVSAKTETALARMISNLRDYLVENGPSLDLKSLAFTLQCGREAMKYRYVAMAESYDELLRELSFQLNGLVTTDKSLNSLDVKSLAEFVHSSTRMKDQLKLNVSSWMKLESVSWIDLYSTPLPVKLNLPSYSFDKNSYWFKARLASEKKTYAIGNTISTPSAILVAQDLGKVSPIDVNSMGNAPVDLKRASSKPILYKPVTHNSISDVSVLQSATELKLAEQTWSFASKVDTKYRPKLLSETVLIVSGDREFVQKFRDEDPKLNIVWIGLNSSQVISGVKLIKVDDSSDFNDIDTAFSLLGVEGAYIDSPTQGQVDTLVIDVKGLKWNKKIVKNRSVHDVVKQAVFVVQSSIKYLTLKKLNVVFVHTKKLGDIQAQIIALSGFAQCLDLEDDRIRSRVVTIETEDKESKLVADRKYNAIAQELNERHVLESCYRNDERWVLSSHELKLEPEAISRSQLAENGVYLITGGLGGLGKIFCRHILNSTDKVTIILMGRREINDTDLLELTSISNKSKILYLQGDVARLSDVRRIIKTIREDFGPLNGIIHCAGAIRDNYVIKHQLSEIEEIVSAKIYGAINLDDVTKLDDLDFMMFCSSLSAIKGNEGQSVYAYSNRFLDAFSLFRNQQRQRNLRKGNAVSVNWPYWRDGGMNVSDEAVKAMVSERGIYPLSTKDGLMVFDYSLSAGSNNIVPVAPGSSAVESNVTQLEVSQRNDIPLDNLTHIENDIVSSGDLGAEMFSEQLDVSIEKNMELESISSSEPDLRMFCLQYLKERIVGILKSDIDNDGSFDESGVDSFLSIKILNSLEKDFGKLRKTLLFEYFTITMLCEYFVSNHADILERMDEFQSLSSVVASTKGAIPKGGSVKNGGAEEPKVTKESDPRLPAHSTNVVNETRVDPLEIKAVKSQFVKPLEELSLSESVSDLSDDVVFEKTLEYLINVVSKALKSNISATDSFDDVGVDSFLSIALLRELEQTFGKLRKTLLFEFFSPQKLTQYFVDEHAEVLKDLFSVTLSSELSEPEVELENNQAFDFVIIPEVELTAQVELSKVYENITRQFSNEGTVARAASIMTPLVFFSTSRLSLFRLKIRDSLILAWPYLGPESEFESSVLELTAYAKSQGADLHFLSTSVLSLVGDVTFSSTPFGALQKIENISEFSLAGKSMRRLRYAIQKVERSGENEVREYRVGTNSETDSSIVNMIDRWCEIKTQINPCVDDLKLDVSRGILADQHRVFLSYKDSTLINVILITKMSGGYLMDMEFYPKDAVYGGLEYSISEIIKLLASEGCSVFSLGGTYGPEIVISDNADEGVRSILNHLRETGDFSQGNLQFKNKFRTVNTPIYLCKPAGGDPTNVTALLMMIADPLDNHGGRQTLPSSMAIPPVDIARHVNSNVTVDLIQPPIAADNSKSVWPDKLQRKRELEQAGFNPCLFDASSIEFDAYTDSWAQLDTAYIQAHTTVISEAVCEYSDVELNECLQQIFGFKHFVLTQSGRSAETVLASSWIGERGDVIQNLLFPTWIFNQIDNGFNPIEMPLDEVFNANSIVLFRGGIDLDALSVELAKRSSRPSMLCLELGNNASGGHPISMSQLKNVRSLADKYEIPLLLDVTRIVDNAEFIRRNETGFDTQGLLDIVKSLCDCADYLSGSFAKNFCLPFGGFIAMRSQKQFQASSVVAKEHEVLMNSEQRAQLLKSVSNTHYFQKLVVARVDAVETVWQELFKNDFPVLAPAGGHCVLLDLSRLNGFSQMKYAIPSFMAWLYQETGIRVGQHNAGMQKNTILNRVIRIAVPVGLSNGDVLEFTRRLVDALARADSTFELKLLEKPENSFGYMKAKFALRDLTAGTYSSQAATPKLKPASSEFGKQTSAKITPSSSSHSDSSNEVGESNNAREEKSLSDDAIAVVGISGRYPKAKDIFEYWDNLQAGIDCVTDMPKRRRELCFDSSNSDTLWGGYLDDVDKFDANFFNVSEADACDIDPQERLFLETAWHAIENAGYHPDSLIETLGTNEIGVYVGVVWSQYHMLSLDGLSSSRLATQYGVANRVSAFMNFTGPSFTLNSACSSSLSALQQACDGLKNQQCRAAVVGGVNLDLHSSKQDALIQSKSLAAGGRCRSFANDADGYVTGEGVGAVVLKTVAQAKKDKDTIYGIIRAVETNHAGHSSGYGVPNPSAQTSVINKALASAELKPESISYVEAHGTGTKLGDSIEFLALTNALGPKGRLDNRSCAIGSVKSNVGHLEAAAGIASLTKSLLQLHHETLVPSLHADELNEYIDLEESHLRLQRELSPWRRHKCDGIEMPLRCGISAFGDGGSNAHVILEEYRDDVRLRDRRTGKIFLLPFSASTEEGLLGGAKVLHHHLLNNTNLDIADISYTLQRGRKLWSKRILFFVESLNDLVEQLSSYCDNPEAYLDPSIATYSGQDYAWGTEVDTAQCVSDYLAKSNVEWPNPDAGDRVRRIGLPGSVFNDSRYWVNTVFPAHTGSLSTLSPSLLSNRVAPSNTMEEALCEIWQDLLGIDELGITDNFFGLGGHSLLALTLVSRISTKWGVAFGVPELFGAQTIRELAVLIESRRDSSIGVDEIDDQMVSGIFPLSLVQYWFFDSEQHKKSHWVNSTHLAIDKTLSVNDIQSAVNLMLTYHDGLRMKFFEGIALSSEYHSWRSCFSKDIDADMFSFLDVSTCDVFTRQRQMVSSLVEAYNQVNSLGSQLCRFILIDEGDELTYRFAMVFHHLVIDGSSQQLFIEGFGNILKSMSAQNPILFPEKTSSPKDYASEVNRVWHEQSRDVELEQRWRDYSWDGVTCLPRDFSTGVNDAESSREKVLIFSELETRTLIKDVAQRTNATILDIMVWGLSRVLNRWNNDNCFQFSLMDAGRENPEINDQVDLTGMIGWLSRVNRYVIQNDLCGTNADNELKSVSDQLNRDKNSASKLHDFLMSSDEILTESGLIGRAKECEIMLNFLGVKDSYEKDGSLIKGLDPINMSQIQRDTDADKAQLKVGEIQQLRGSVLDVQAYIENDLLTIKLMYSKNLHTESTITRLIDYYYAALSELIGGPSNGTLDGHADGLSKA